MHIRYILTRSITVLLAIVIGLYALNYLKTKKRQARIVSELNSLASESSFFRQFSGEDAEKTLVRAVGLIADAHESGLEPDVVIDRALGVKEKYFAMDGGKREFTLTETLIRTTLRANYENFRKLGYEADYHTLQEMNEGKLPTVRIGSAAGKKAMVSTIIDPELSPGLESVVANLEIRPQRDVEVEKSDVDIALALRLATNLADAGIIERGAAERIATALRNQEKDESEQE